MLVKEVKRMGYILNALLGIVCSILANKIDRLIQSKAKKKSPSQPE